jgi:hypothetical protein
MAHAAIGIEIGGEGQGILEGREGLERGPVVLTEKMRMERFIEVLQERQQVRKDYV